MWFLWAIHSYINILLLYYISIMIYGTSFYVNYVLDFLCSRILAWQTEFFFSPLMLVFKILRLPSFQRGKKKRFLEHLIKEDNYMKSIGSHHEKEAYQWW